MKLEQNEKEAQKVKNELMQTIIALRGALKARDAVQVLEHTEKLSKRMTELGYRELSDQATFLKAIVGIPNSRLYSRGLSYL